MNDPSTFRERAGVLVSAIVVMALIATGPIQMAVQVFTGQTVAFDQTWLVTVAGLAGTAFGFLIGKQTTNGPAVTTSVPTTDPVSVRTTVTKPGD